MSYTTAIDDSKKLAIVIAAILEYQNSEQLKLLNQLGQPKPQPLKAKASRLNLWKQVIRNPDLDYVTTTKNSRYNISRRSSKSTGN